MSAGEITGAAYRFMLPTDVDFQLVDDSVRAGDGQHVRQWRWSPTGSAPYCFVMAVEQPNYESDFPQSSIDLYEASAKAGDTIVRNEILSDPPAGATAAVAQEMRSELTGPDGQVVRVRGLVREQLTPGRTLLQLVASGPQDLDGRCGLEQIADSLVPTGREAPTDPPQPSAPTIAS